MDAVGEGRRAPTIHVNGWRFGPCSPASARRGGRQSCGTPGDVRVVPAPWGVEAVAHRGARIRLNPRGICRERALVRRHAGPGVLAHARPSVPCDAEGGVSVAGRSARASLRMTAEPTTDGSYRDRIVAVEPGGNEYIAEAGPARQAEPAVLDVGVAEPRSSRRSSSACSR